MRPHLVSLKELRTLQGFTQNTLARALNVQQSALSKLENQDDALVSTLFRYVDALGGKLSLQADFSDQTFLLYQFLSAGNSTSPQKRAADLKSIEDLISYKKLDDKRRNQALNEMVTLSEELGFGYE